jgi:Protein of unknown function (DUF3761)
MKKTWAWMAMLAAGGWAQTVAPAGAPLGATGICKDGTYSMAATKSGACAGHKGVHAWYAAPAGTAKPAAMPAPTPAPAAAIQSAPAPIPAATAPAAAPATAAAPAKKLSPAQAAAAKPQVPGGGKGLVWVNTSSNVYHCTDDPYYGRTKAGAYMTEDAAKAKGARGDRGQSCAGK